MIFLKNCGCYHSELWNFKLIFVHSFHSKLGSTKVRSFWEHSYLILILLKTMTCLSARVRKPRASSDRFLSPPPPVIKSNFSIPTTTHKKTPPAEKFKPERFPERIPKRIAKRIPKRISNRIQKRNNPQNLKNLIY